MIVNQIPVGNTDRSETGCCPRFDPVPWEEQKLTFLNLPFVRVTTRSFFYMPLNMARVMTAVHKQIGETGAEAKDFLMLSHDESPWRAEHLIRVAKPIPGAEMVGLSGHYLTKVFEGPFSNAGKWMTELQEHAKKHGKTPRKSYFYYTTCPKCAKVFGKNFVVGVVEV